MCCTFFLFIFIHSFVTSSTARANSKSTGSRTNWLITNNRSNDDETVIKTKIVKNELDWLEKPSIHSELLAKLSVLEEWQSNDDLKRNQSILGKEFSLTMSYSGSDPLLSPASPSDPSFSSSSFSNCSSAFEDKEWYDSGLLASLVALIVINCLVLAGNTLVILAVFYTQKLRTVTNFFIVSLAVADMSLGIMVLPFSVSVEVFDTWFFGRMWCSVWLAIDVWVSTASILNLCVISLDRYVAVTRPVSYPLVMTKRKGKLLICFVWGASFLICFPPLVGWNDKHQNLAMADDACHLTCELTNETGYVVYSASGSFFVPMLVMLFFYWRIYLAALKTTKAINRGFKTMSDSKQGSSRRFERERVTLRIHRGKNLSENCRTDSGSMRYHGNMRKARSENLHVDQAYETPNYVPFQQVELISTENHCMTKTRILNKPNSMNLNNHDSSFQLDFPSSPTSRSSISVDRHDDGFVNNHGPARTSSRMGRRNIKNQVKKFRMETKAAKTLGIIVGVFIVCWLPFFTIYVVRGFCPDCINQTLFSVLFWLGYCNAAINPLIYAQFSKDFRDAFKSILCKWMCNLKRYDITLKTPSILLPQEDDSDECRSSFSRHNQSMNQRSSIGRLSVSNV